MAVNLEALAELDVRIGDGLLENGLTLVQRQAAQVAPVEVKQVDRDYHDLGRFPLEFILHDREVGSAVIAVRNISGRRRWSKLAEWLRLGQPVSRKIGMVG
jgi:hypothetical protein